MFFNNKGNVSTRYIDKKYRNVADEGRGSHRYYVKKEKAHTREFWLMVFGILLAILIIVYIVAMMHGHGYVQQWHIIIQDIFSYGPGKITGES